MRIILDAMGSDEYPKPEVLAAIAARVVMPDDEIILVGDEAAIKAAMVTLGN